MSPTGGFCAACSVGKQPNADYTGCLDCGAGEYSDGSLCQRCPAGTQPKDDQSDCDSCVLFETADYSPGGLSCDSCDAGTEPNADRTLCRRCSTVSDAHVSPTGDPCVQCSAGTEPNAQTTACQSCISKTDTYWYSADGSPCIRCEAGEEPNLQRTGCDICVGKYSPDGRQCLDCGPGSEPTTTTGATNCTACDVSDGASFISKSGEACLSCDVGQQPNALHSDCFDCNAGEYSDGSLCTACPAGTQPQEDQSGCDSCILLGPNLHSPSGVECIGCGVGTEPFTNRTGCQSCSAVSDAHVSATGDPCTRCDPGSQPNAELTACESCNSQSDTFWYSSDGSPCVRCEAGGEPNLQRTGCDTCVDQHSPDGRQCLTCPPGSGPSSDRTACDPCDDYYYSPAGLCESCAPPNLVVDERTVCTIPYRCPIGTKCQFSDGCSVASQCEDCPIGHAGNTGYECLFCNESGKVANAEQSACVQCPAGREPSPDRSTCQRCVNTTFSSFGIECRECPSPNVVDDTHASCTACRAGTGPAPNRSTCFPCGSPHGENTETNTYSTFGVCQACARGFANTTEKTRCDDVDECAQDNGQCDRLATRNGMASCTNTQGSHECGLCLEEFEGSGDLALGGCRLPDIPAGNDRAPMEPTTQMTLGIAASVFLLTYDEEDRAQFVANMTSDLSLALEVSSTHPLNLTRVQYPRLCSHTSPALAPVQVTEDQIRITNLGIARRALQQTGSPSSDDALAAQLFAQTGQATFDLTVLSLGGPAAMLRLQDQLADPESALMAGVTAGLLQPAESIDVEYRCPVGMRRGEGDRFCSTCPFPQYTPDGESCTNCPAGRAPADFPLPSAWTLHEHYDCQCAPGFYDKTGGVIVCHGTEGFAYSHLPPDSKSLDPKCEPCDNLECVDCISTATPDEGYAGRPLLKPGWATIGLSSDTAWFDQPPTTPPHRKEIDGVRSGPVSPALREVCCGEPFEYSDRLTDCDPKSCTDPLGYGLRDIFHCPVHPEACLGEADWNVSTGELTRLSSNDTTSGKRTNVTMNGTTLALCAMGYEGNLCSVCSKNADARDDWVEGYWDEGDWVDAPDQYTRSISECKPCEKRSLEHQIYTALTILGVLLVIYGIVHWIKNSQMRDHQLMLAVFRLLPDLLVDLKVFVGLYQVLTGMSQTLLIEYPPAVVFFFDEIRAFVNIDFFSIPAIGCLIGTNGYMKFWAMMSLPLWILLIMWLVYHHEMRKSHHGLEGVAMDLVQLKNWKEAQTEAKKKHRHTFDEKTNKWKQAGPEASHKSGNARPVGLPRVKSGHAMKHLMLQRAADVANARQLCVGWGFLLVFLVYPSICTKTFSMFYCFTVSDPDAAAPESYLVADFEISCESTMYKVHKWIAAVFVVLYPIGIPVAVGWQLFWGRENIKKGMGPSEFEMLCKVVILSRFACCRFANPKSVTISDKDYKRDRPLWEIYGMLEKAVLVGVLGFIFPGKLMQSAMGFLISSFFLLAFTNAMPFLHQPTNVLSIVGHCIASLSYFATILLKVDLKGEVLTPNGVGVIMIAVNVPMALYFVYDVKFKLQRHIAEFEEHLGVSVFGVAAESTMGALRQSTKAITESAKDLTKLVSNDDEDEDDAESGEPTSSTTTNPMFGGAAEKAAKRAKKAKKKGVETSNPMFGSDESDASD